MGNCCSAKKKQDNFVPYLDNGQSCDIERASKIYKQINIMLDMNSKKYIAVSTLGESLKKYRIEKKLKSTHRFFCDKETIIEINCENQFMIKDIIKTTKKNCSEIKIIEIGEQLSKLWKQKEYPNPENPLDFDNSPKVIIDRERFKLKSMMKLKQCTLDELRKQLNLLECQEFCMIHEKEKIPIELTSEKKMKMPAIVYNNRINIIVSTHQITQTQRQRFNQIKRQNGFML